MSASRQVESLVSLYRTNIAPLVEDVEESDDVPTFDDAASAAHEIASTAAELADDVMMSSDYPDDALAPLEDVAHYMHQVALAFESADDDTPSDDRFDTAYSGAVRGLSEAAERLGADVSVAVAEE